MRKMDVFIAGAGPVGLAAAIELARRYIPVRIVDPDPAVSPESRALAVNPRTLDLLAPSGVAERLLAHGHRVREVKIRLRQRTLGTIALSRVPHRHNFLLILPQSQTESLLEDHLTARGVTVGRGKGLASFAANSGELAISLSDDTQTTATHLLGADGAHSTVRKTLGLGFPGESEPRSFGLCDVELSDWPFAFDTAVMTILPAHVAGFIPMGPGRGRFFTTKPGALNNLPADAKVARTLWETDFKISYRQVESYQKGNVFLAGDAAHIHSPVGGRGMNLGIEDACWFAWLLSEGREAEYSALRHPVAASVLKTTSALTDAIAAPGLVTRLMLRTVAPIVLAMPPLQRRALRNLAALDTPAPPWL